MSYLFSILLVLWCLIFPLFLVHADSKPVINEFLAHPGTGAKEWVELYVPDGVDVTNYWIDDDTDFANDSGNSSKKQITSVVQGSDSRHEVFELSSSMFNNSGDTVALFAPDGTLVDHYDYTNDPGIDVSIGRTPDAVGDFQALSFATRGSPNSIPKPPDTATPAPTDKTIPTSKPTPTSKPVKSIAVTSAVSNKSDVSVLSDSTFDSSTKKSIATPTKIASNGAYPTAILNTITKSPAKKLSLPKKQLLIKGVSSSMPQIIAVSTGGLLLLGCGILLYLKKQGMWFFDSEKE
jgi:hypothetical protein